MNRKPIAVALVAAVVLGSLGYRQWSPQSFEYAGTLEATRIDLPARVATIAKTLHVEEGQVVKKGELLLELGCEDLEISARLIFNNYQRALKLRKTGSISNEAFDQAKNKQDEAAMKISWCKIHSPVDGTVLTQFVEANEWVNPGSKMITVAELNNLWVYFYIPQKLMSQLQVGTQVRGRIPEIHQSFTGRIQKINEEAEFTPKNVQTESERTRLVYGVKVKFENPKGLLKPGMTMISDLRTTDLQ